MRSESVGPRSRNLAGQVAIVTGSSSGIGREVAIRLAHHGVRVVVNSSASVEAGERVVSELETAGAYIKADITDAGARQALLERTVSEFGRLDILVNNAGWTTTIPHSDLDGLTDEIFRRTFEVNVFGTWALTRAAIPILRQAPSGNVVTVTSIAGHRPMGSSIAYAMSKAALNHMTALLAKSHAPVRFNAVAPGLVDTPWTAAWGATRTEISSVTPVSRLSTAAEQAEAVLACVLNRFMNGAVIVVDGGLSTVR
jgi:ketoreductase RED2